MSSSPRRLPTAAAAAALLLAGCTGIGIREFTRESYRPPAPRPASVRTFDAAPESVWQSFAAVVVARGGRFEERDDALPRGAVVLSWSGTAEAAASVDLGRVQQVVTETTRHYRSWSPLDVGCNACVVRRGNVIDQHTRVLGERVVPLDPAAYRIEAWVDGRVEPAPDGSRLVLALRPEVEPMDPPGLQPVSTGRLEESLLDAVAARLAIGED